MAYFLRALARLRKERTTVATEPWVRDLIGDAGGGGGGGPVAWADVTGKPSTFTPSAHTHPTSDVTGLDTALAGKQPLATVLTNTTAAFTTAQETKLSGIAAGATVNASDAALRDRATHTGTQDAATITGTKLSTFISDFASAVAALITGKQDTLVSGTNLKTVNGNSLLGSGDLSISGGGGGGASPAVAWVI